MTAELHPDCLTIETVLEHYGRLLRHRIGQFHMSDTVDDCFQQVIVAMITPSSTMGTTYLERYNPSRGSAKTYVLMFCMQQMMKMHAREKNRRRLMPDPVPLVYDDPEGDELERDVVAECSVADPSWSTKYEEETVRTREDLYKLLQGTRHMHAHSMSPSGEPRSTVYMLELLLWGGLSITEIAHRLAVTSSEVSRRFKALRTEPRIAQLLAHTATVVVTTTTTLLAG